MKSLTYFTYFVKQSLCARCSWLYWQARREQHDNVQQVGVPARLLPPAATSPPLRPLPSAAQQPRQLGLPHLQTETGRQRRSMERASRSAAQSKQECSTEQAGVQHRASRSAAQSKRECSTERAAGAAVWWEVGLTGSDCSPCSPTVPSLHESSQGHIRQTNSQHVISAKGQSTNDQPASRSPAPKRCRWVHGTRAGRGPSKPRTPGRCPCTGRERDQCH